VNRISKGKTFSVTSPFVFLATNSLDRLTWPTVVPGLSAG
jgi:hypothetical protein